VNFRPLALLVVLSGCSIEEGDACEPPRGECVGSSEALLCVDREIRRLSCRGPSACAAIGESVRCDQSHAREGDACAGGVACTADGASFLVCTDGVFSRGADCPTGCVIEGDRATCPAPELHPPLE
jgi:hypothetical protein